MHLEPLTISNRRELFVGHHLIERLDGASLFLHAPERREVVLVHDAPWEGNTCGYHTVLPDGSGFRTYYRGSHADVVGEGDTRPAVTCVAESPDGIRWTKPDLGLIPWPGARATNIVLEGRGTHNFAPFRDANPAARPEAAYRALGRGIERHDTQRLYAFHSPDGLRWSLTRPEPLDLPGVFDSQNLAFWDPNAGAYRIYFRDFREPGRIRDIKTALSDDFITWSAGEWLTYPGAPDEHLYTNQIQPYHRAPHIYVGFPTRFIKERGQVTEGLFMSSRDGRTFHRWGEAIVRPGPDPGKWGNRCNYIWCGVIETPSDLPGAPKELSLFTNEAYYTGRAVRTRRHVYRMDGFVSVRAPLSGGEVLTKPLRFEGGRLALNLSTSAAGSVRAELQDAEGHPLPGYALSDGSPFYGDAIDHVVSWAAGPDVSAFSGRPVRLRLRLSDADVYAFQFQTGSPGR